MGSSTKLRSNVALIIGVLAALCLGFLSINSQVLWFDDEGYVMISLRSYLAGKRIYSEFYTQYGPAFFQLRSLLFSWLPLTHDVNRVVAFLEWLVGCGIFSLTAFTLLRDKAWALGAFVLGTLYLEPVVKEPGHPQTLIFLLSGAGLFALIRNGGKAASARDWCVAGAMTGLIALIKVNVGLYAALAAAVLGLTFLNSRKWRTWHVGASALSAVAFVFVIGVKGDIAANGFVLAAVCAVVALTAQLLQSSRASTQSWKRLAGFAGAFAATAVLSLGVELVRGASVSDLVWGILLQHRQFASGSVYFPAGAAAAALLGCLVAIAVARGSVPGGFVAKAKVLVGGAVTLAALFGLLTDRALIYSDAEAFTGNAGYIWLFLPAVSWLVVAGQTGTAHFQRAALATFSTFSLLLAFPIQGTQLAYASILGTLSALVMLHDGAEGLRLAGRSVRPWLKYGFAATAFLAIGLRLQIVADRYFDRYVSPALAGASNLRLPEAEADLWHDTVQLIQENCSGFLTTNGMNSLHFWTGIAPFTAHNMTLWDRYLPEERQREYVAAMTLHAQPCVVYNVDYWNSAKGELNFAPTPFGDYLIKSYVATHQVGRFRLLKRR